MAEWRGKGACVISLFSSHKNILFYRNNKAEICEILSIKNKPKADILKRI